jgi:hypothetical protein
MGCKENIQLLWRNKNAVADQRHLQNRVALLLRFTTFAYNGVKHIVGFRNLF